MIREGAGEGIPPSLFYMRGAMKATFAWIPIAICLNSPLFGQLIKDPIYPFERLRWGMGLAEALTGALKDSLPVLSREKATGKIQSARGHFFYGRSETLFDIPAKVSYAFTQSDSVLRYVLISYIEVDTVPGSPAGGRDSLWNRIARRYDTGYSETRTGQLTQREWTKGGTTIISNRVDGLARALVLSLTPIKKR